MRMRQIRSRHALKVQIDSALGLCRSVFAEGHGGPQVSLVRRLNQIRVCVGSVTEGLALRFTYRYSSLGYMCLRSHARYW